MALKIGIVGTGRIARMHARAMALAEGVQPTAAASRSLARAAAFAEEAGGLTPVEGVGSLLELNIDAVYAAVPTAAKEEIALKSLEAGKHVLVEKPLASQASARRMAELAEAKGLVVMDATHFTHNPRTRVIRERMAKEIGAPVSLSTFFHADIRNPDDIRYDPALEPMGALGDLGWYNLRAAVELLGSPEPEDIRALGRVEDGVLTGASGIIGFEDGTRTVFDCGFRSGSFAQELEIVGTRGILSMDDFVHDWERGKIDVVRAIPAGYALRQGRVTRDDIVYRKTPSDRSHVVLLLEAFAAAAADPAGAAAAEARGRMVATQRLLDLVWDALS